jgi:toluene monooxygenase system ferredoxin subunit
MFVKVSGINDIWEGGVILVAALDRRVLLVWPDGGTLNAFQGNCPHQGLPLDGAFLDGGLLTCPHHFWVYDAGSGVAVDPPECDLIAYPVKIEGDGVFVDPDERLPNPLPE